MNESRKIVLNATHKGCEHTAIMSARGKSPNRILPMAITAKKLEDNAVSPKDWSRFAQWIHCMCVVTFDLNLGQALEFVYPPQFVPADQEVSNICYMAFPDSNSGCMGDNKFHMRFRVTPSMTANVGCSESASVQQYNEVQRIYNGACVPILRADKSHFFGFVYFRQKRDANLPRGYFQKSFIIITRLPFFNLFYDVLSQLAPCYFDGGNSVLEEACSEINERWPALEAGIPLQLPLFEQRYHIHLPAAASSSSRKANNTKDTTASSTNSTNTLTSTAMVATLPPKVIVSVNELELFHSLSFIMNELYTLWELILIAEPLVVVGTSPADCSHMVQSLVSLIVPLEYCAEARPYFTIHDSEFKEFVRECGRTPPPVILGVTNPFFVKLLKDWPHLLRLVDNQLNMQQQAQLYQKSVQKNNSVTSLSGGDAGSSTVKKVVGGNTGSTVSSSLSSSLVTLSSNNDGATPGLYTKYKPFLRKDKALIKKVVHGMKTKRPSHVQTALIRRHLLELTQSFMIPLERYIASLMPLQKDISPFKSAPNANAFKLEDFLATLELSGPQLTSPLKGDWKGLYRRFFNSPNFRGWYESRHRELQLTLQELQLQALFDANLEQWAKDKQEVEIIDMILKLKQKLNLYGENAADGRGREVTSVGSNISSNNNGSSGTGTRDQIRAQINSMKELLPHDLRNVVNL